MKKLMIFAALAVVSAAGLRAQAPASAPTFEVATIKPAGPITAAAVRSGALHVGMKVEAGRVDIGYMSIADLIRTAYRVKPYQISGPDWINSERFDILANLPEGASTDQVPEMLKSLLAERFKLTVHRENKDHSVYALIVGKNGPKLTEAAPEANTSASPSTSPAATGPVLSTLNGPVSINRSSDGLTVTTGKSETRMTMGPGGTMRMEMKRTTLPALAETLSPFLDRPVVDKTGLKGEYQVALDLSMDDLRKVAQANGVTAMGMGPAPSASTPADSASDPGASSVFASIEQLGLKLDPQKAPIEVVVIDHVEKTPTEN